MDKLKKAGVKEQFVKQICEAAEGALASSRSEDHTDENDFNRRYPKWTCLVCCA